MKIQKGIVKYKDRDDIVCTYGITDGGKNYYFIELEGAKRLSNGNIIASTELVEAIDPMFKAKHIGVIDGSGKEVIPFVHRVIRPIHNDILLAELAEPVTESVKEANRMKNDSTSNLVATASTIKEKMNAKMGADGRFVINDQFSDATVYDINGNNLVNKEFYSFVGVSGDKLFLCKNTPESEIVELPLTAEAAKTETIDVSEVQVPQETVEKALVKSVDETVAPAPAAPAVEEPKAEEAILPPLEAAAPVAEAPVAEEVKVEEPVTESTIPEPAAAMFNYFASPEQNAQAMMESSAPPVIPIAEENLPQKETVSEEISLPPVEDAAPVPAPVAEEPVAPVAEAPAPVEAAVAPVVEEAPAPVEAVAPVEEVKAEAPAPEKSPLEIAMAADPNQEFPIPVEEPAPVVEEAAPVAEEPAAPVAETPASVEEPAPVEEAKAEEVALPPVEEAPIEGSLLPKPEEVAPTAEEVIEQETGGDLIDRSLQGIVVETPDNEVDEADNENVDLDESVEDSSLDGLFLDHEEFNDNDERFAHSMVHTDRIEDVDVDDFDTKYRTPVVIDDEDTIMTDVAKSMGALIKQNRELKTTLTTTEEKLGKVLASRRNLADRSTMLEKKIEVLTSKLRSLDTTLSKLESKYQSLEAKNLDQERIIESQAHELEVIRPQLQGKEDLVQLLADAQVILGTDDEYSYKRKAA